MSNATTDLWPEDLIAVDAVTPAMILNEQAEALNKRTGGIVRGQAVAVHHSSLTIIDFELFAPLVTFRSRLLQVRHANELPYPCVVISTILEDPSGALATEEADHWDLSVDVFHQARAVDSPDQLRQVLRRIFNAPSTKSLLFSLLARSNEITVKREVAAP